jgi:hypothetical protein
MKSKTTMTTMLLISFIFFTWFHCYSKTIKQENMKQKEIENYLKTAKVVSDIVDPQAGRTEGWIISMDDGKIQRRGYFKHMDRSRPHFIPDSYKYEIAAYELNKLLGLNIVPPLVEREIQGIKGSLQMFIEDFIKESDRKRRNIEPPDPLSFQNTLEEINVFENLVYDECFDADDTFVQKKDWKVWRVDYSEAFEPTSDLRPGSKITRCSKNLFQNLLKVEDEAVKAKLSAYLNDEEITALLERKKLIIQKITQLIKEKGEEAVLF